jgi:hypothetical protein
MSVGKPNTLGSESSQLRRGDPRLLGASGEVSPAQVIGKNHHDMWPLGDFLWRCVVGRVRAGGGAPDQ